MSSVPTFDTFTSFLSDPVWNEKWNAMFNQEDTRLKPPETVKPVDSRTRLDLVCHYFARGQSLARIAELLADRHGIEGVSREMPYSDISNAVKEGLIKYVPSPLMALTDQLRRRYPRIMEAWVPEYGGRMAVIAKAAEMIGKNVYGIAEALTKEYIQDFDFPNELGIELPPRRSRQCLPQSKEQTAWWKIENFLELENAQKRLQDKQKEKQKQKQKQDCGPLPVPLVIEVRLGFSGGATMGVTAAELGHFLEPMLEQMEKQLKDLALETLENRMREVQQERLSEKLVRLRFKVKLRLLFVNLVPGFDTDPINHPVAFLTSMIHRFPEVAARSELLCYSATPFLDITGKAPLDPPAPPGPKQLEEFVNRYGLDIIITSAGSIDDEHSTFRKYLREMDPQKVMEVLKRKGMEGDILWQPVSKQNPLFLTDFSEEDREVIRFRPKTLIDLRQLAEQMERRQDVILVLAPCSHCGMPKDQIL